MINSIFIISFYNKRPADNLLNLINQLKYFNVQIAIVVNDDNSENIYFEKKQNIFYLRRPNIGMNIGAWDAGYKYFDHYENYFFFQDECYVKKINFYEKYLQLISNKKNGIVGESINPKWDKPWDDIKGTDLNYMVDDGEKKMTRLDFYFQQIKKWSINVGQTGKHLRALNFALRRDVLEKIDGFPIGDSKEECIAAEIGISRKVEEYGFDIVQSDKKHFNYIGHKEWDKMGMVKKKIN